MKNIFFEQKHNSQREQHPLPTPAQRSATKKISLAFAAVVALLGFCSQLFAEKKVMILAGSGGTAEYRVKFYSQATHLRDIMVSKFGFADEDIALLVETQADSMLQFMPNDAQSIKSIFSKFKTDLQADDVLLVFLLGHGSFDGEWAKLNITGPDLRDMDFANLLNQLPTERMLFVNMASASGPFLEKLSKKGRIIVTATRNGIERNATRFAEHFLNSLQLDLDADLNKDGELSVTEAFIFARDNLIRDYDEKKQLRPEHPLLDDNGDGEGTETPDLLSGDGVLAANFLFKQQKQPNAPLASSGAAVLSGSQKSVLEKINALKEKKESMSEEDYYNELEKLMIELARLKEKK